MCGSVQMSVSILYESRWTDCKNFGTKVRASQIGYRASTFGFGTSQGRRLRIRGTPVNWAVGFGIQSARRRVFPVPCSGQDCSEQIDSGNDYEDRYENR